MCCNTKTLLTTMVVFCRSVLTLWEFMWNTGI